MNDPEHSPPTPGCIAAILPAAGSGQRFGAHENKLFAQLAGQPLWWHSASRLRSHPDIGAIVMAVSEADRPRFEGEFGTLIRELEIQLVPGGTERTDSVKAGLNWLSQDDSIVCVAVHDAARPLIRREDLDAVFAIAWQTGAALLAAPISGTVKRDLVQARQCQTVDRRELWVAHTPQVFRVGLLNQAYEKHNGRPATDDAELVERLGHDVSLVRGSTDNLKITYPEDLLIAEAILAGQTHHA